MSWSDELRERYQAATTTSTSIPLPGWTTVRITGADRTSFLHNMCTNDIKGLAVGEQCEAFLTDVKAKIVGHVIVFAEAEQLLLLTVPGQAERIIASLDRYIVREAVQLADESSKIRWALTVGLATTKNISHGTATRAQKLDWVLASCTQLWCGGMWMGMIAGPKFAEQRETTADDSQLWHALRIESGWPLFGVDFDGSNLPQEVGRDVQAISFRKGCYLGQETVARIDALGHVNKRLCTVRLAGDAAPGDELLAEAPDRPLVGHVTSASYSPRRDAWLALAMVRRGHNEPGAKLVCRDMSAEVVPTPAVVA
jgi:folate-binding protein YgfZ